MARPSASRAIAHAKRGVCRHQISHRVAVPELAVDESDSRPDLSLVEHSKSARISPQCPPRQLGDNGDPGT